MYLIFDSSFDPSKARSKTDKCLDVNASLTEEEERIAKMLRDKRIKEKKRSFRPDKEVTDSAEPPSRL